MVTRLSEGQENDHRVVISRGNYVPNEIEFPLILDAIAMSRTGFRVYFHLHTVCIIELYCDETNEMIAKNCGVSERAVTDAKKELLGMGLIHLLSKGKGHEPDRYVLGDLHDANRKYIEKNYPSNHSVKFETLPLTGVVYAPIDTSIVEEIERETGWQNLLPEVESQNLLPSHREGTFSPVYDPDALTKELSSAFSLPLPLDSSNDVSLVNNKERTFHLESTVPTSDVLYDDLSTVFDDPEPVVRPRPFRLTAPRPIVDGSQLKRPRPKQVIKTPEWAIDWLLRLCYNIKTTQERILAGKGILGRCSGAVTNLVKARADLTRYEDWERWWWSFATNRPSPETVQATYLKGIERSEEIGDLKTGLDTGIIKGQARVKAQEELDRERDEAAEFEKRIAEGMLRRAQEGRQ